MIGRVSYLPSERNYGADGFWRVLSNFARPSGIARLVVTRQTPPVRARATGPPPLGRRILSSADINVIWLSRARAPRDGSRDAGNFRAAFVGGQLFRSRPICSLYVRRRIPGEKTNERLYGGRASKTQRFVEGKWQSNVCVRARVYKLPGACTNMYRYE